MWGPSPSQLLIAAVDLASPFCHHYYYYNSYHHHHHHTRLSLVPILGIPYSYLTCPLFTRLRGALLSSLVALQALVLFACTSVLTPEPPPPPLIVGARRAPSPPRAPHNNSSNSSTSLLTIACVRLPWAIPRLEALSPFCSNGLLARRCCCRQRVAHQETRRLGPAGRERDAFLPQGILDQGRPRVCPCASLTQGQEPPRLFFSCGVVVRVRGAGRRQEARRRGRRRFGWTAAGQEAVPRRA